MNSMVAMSAAAGSGESRTRREAAETERLLKITRSSLCSWPVAVNGGVVSMQWGRKKREEGVRGEVRRGKGDQGRSKGRAFNVPMCVTMPPVFERLIHCWSR